MTVPVTINVNGRRHRLEVELRPLLVDFLRDVIGRSIARHWFRSTSPAALSAATHRAEGA